MKYYVALANLIDSDEEQTEVGQRITRLANSFRGKDVQVARDAEGALIVRSESKGIVAQVKLTELADEARRSILQQENELLRGVRSIKKEKENLQKMLNKLHAGVKTGPSSPVPPLPVGRAAGPRDDASDLQQFVFSKSGRQLGPVPPSSASSHGQASSVGDPLNQDGLVSARRGSAAFTDRSAAGTGRTDGPRIFGPGEARLEQSQQQLPRAKHHQRSAAAIDALLADSGGSGGWAADGGAPSRGWSPGSSSARMGLGGVVLGSDDSDSGEGNAPLSARRRVEAKSSSLKSPSAAARTGKKKKVRRKKTRRASATSEIRSGDLYKDGRAMGKREASDDEKADWRLSQLHAGGVGALDIDIVAYTRAKPSGAKPSKKRTSKAKKKTKKSKKGPGTGRFRFDRRDAGCRVAIRAARYGTLLKGTVAAFDAPRSMHLVVYDSGERRWHDMMQKEFRVLKYVDAQKRRDERDVDVAADDGRGSGHEASIPTSDIDANAAAATFAYAPMGTEALQSTELASGSAFYMEPAGSMSPAALQGSAGKRKAARPRKAKNAAGSTSKSRTHRRATARKGRATAGPSLGMAGFGQRARPSKRSAGRNSTGIKLGSVRDAGGTGALV